jgi:hypothetical protein
MCTDAAEMAIIQEEQSPMGPLLRAVNAVADAIAGEFPHIAVETLAYEYTRSPPAITTPRANVIIRYCVEPGQCDLRGTVSEYEANEREWRYNQPRPADKRNTSAVEDLQAWSKVCDRIYVCE